MSRTVMVTHEHPGSISYAEIVTREIRAAHKPQRSRFNLLEALRVASLFIAGQAVWMIYI